MAEHNKKKSRKRERADVSLYWRGKLSVARQIADEMRSWSFLPEDARKHASDAYYALNRAEAAMGHPDDR